MIPGNIEIVDVVVSEEVGPSLLALFHVVAKAARGQNTCLGVDLERAVLGFRLDSSDVSALVLNQVPGPRPGNHLNAQLLALLAHLDHQIGAAPAGPDRRILRLRIDEELFFFPDHSTHRAEAWSARRSAWSGILVAAGFTYWVGFVK